jgi:hypothetical protein
VSGAIRESCAGSLTITRPPPASWTPGCRSPSTVGSPHPAAEARRVRHVKINSPDLSTGIPGAVALACLYALEFSALLASMAMYKKSDRPLLAFLVSQAGVVFLLAVLASVVSALVIVHLLRNTAPPRRKHFSGILVLNLWSVILVLVTAEVVIRVFAVNTPAGVVFANTLLLPRSWENFAARNRAILAKASTWGSYFVYDSMLGWTVGRSRRSKDGLYFSSVEGIRSPRVGIAFARASAKHRIAIVGDSFTFGLEVPYEDTWGHRLELMLGPEYEVLNFGADGYGIDQTYLRYQQDVLSWHPDIVILGMINDDLTRTMSVYGFLKFIDSEMPFPKPRFILKDNALTPLNLPLPTPHSIFANRSIMELPFVEYDASFQRAEWEWRFYHHAYSIRFLLSRFPQWSAPGSTVSDEAKKSVNGELFRLFMQLARKHGSTPIVVYFPSRPDFEAVSTSSGGITSVAKKVLQANNIPFLDMTDCVSKISPDERFVTRHYSSATNAAIARCLKDSIAEASRPL